MTQTEYKQVVVNRLTHIQNLAREKRFSEIETLINSGYV